MVGSFRTEMEFRDHHVQNSTISKPRKVEPNWLKNYVQNHRVRGWQILKTKHRYLSFHFSAISFLPHFSVLPRDVFSTQIF